MRLTDAQRNTIKAAVARVIGADSKVWLFGSRVDDVKRGGDIDLFVETEQAIPNRVSVLCKLEGALVMGLGDRKIDILLKDGQTNDAPIFRAAREKGIPL